MFMFFIQKIYINNGVFITCEKQLYRGVLWCHDGVFDTTQL